MIAIPVKTDREETAIAPLFGKAKWFALVENDGTITFWRNDIQSGRAVVDHFKSIGVDSVIFHDMGANPCLLLQRAKIACYHSGKGRVLLKDALAYLKEGDLIEVTPMNMAEFVEQGQKHSSGEHHEHHEHHDGEHCSHS